MSEVTCAMCGQVFDPSEYRTCAACPLKSGCQLACCPNCGFETVDPEQSVLARTFANLIGKGSQDKRQKMEKMNTLTNVALQFGTKLTELPVGAEAQILNFSQEISDERKAQLQAYGIVPGSSIRVKQHKPVTIIQVDHTELAFETELASTILLKNQ